MFHWEPEGRYCHWLCTAIAPFWFSTEHLWAAITPFWLSTDDILKEIKIEWLAIHVGLDFHFSSASLREYFKKEKEKEEMSWNWYDKPPGRDWYWPILSKVTQWVTYCCHFYHFRLQKSQKILSVPEFIVYCHLLFNTTKVNCIPASALNPEYKWGYKRYKSEIKW